MKPRLQLKPKNKVKLKASVRLITVGAAFAVVVAVGFILYLTIGENTDSLANQETRLTGFSGRKAVLISPEILRGSDELINFPLFIELKADELKSTTNGGQVIQAKGYDIRFTKSDGISILSSQIESYDPKTGELKAWLLIDTLSKTKGKDLFVYFGNATIRSELPPVLWNNGFEAVYHLNGNAQAANSRKLSATVQGTEATAGPFGQALSFSSQRKDFASIGYQANLDLRQEFTISTWIYLNELGRKQVILSNQGDHRGGYAMYISENNRLAASIINPSGIEFSLDDIDGGEILEKEHWYHVNLVFSAKEKSLKSYVDGILDRQHVINDIPASSAASLEIGRDLFDQNSYFNGQMDELRISSVARSQYWLATAFYNESVAARLFSLGETEVFSLSQSEVKSNKLGMQEISNSERQKIESENQLQASARQGSSEAPGVISANAEVIQARLENIRRVAKQNQ